MNAIPLRETLTDRMERLLLACVFFVALPHAFNLDAPVFLFFSLLVGWRLAALYRARLVPGRWVLLAFTLAGGLLVWSQYHRFYGREAGGALLLVGLGLKLLEMKTRREVYLVIDLVFFVALTQYLFSQSIPMAGYTLAAVGLAVAVLIGVNAGPSLSVPDILRRSGVLLAQAIPMMVVLFLFFPRVAGPLWKLPDDGRSARSGLSDVMEPGSISHLGQSAEPAFGVDFDGPLPPPAERYWRGPVFWFTDGVRWKASLERALPAPPPVAFSGPSYRYAITIEPHRRQWVFALELPSTIPAGVGQTAEYLLLAREKLADRQRFELASRPAYRTGPITEDERRRGLQLPGEPAPRLKELVRSWQADGADPAEVVAKSLRYFREQPFTYTLNPPPLPDRPVERFLFETRKGFCEHFATSFVTLMRIAGIPARIVTGYQGGQWIPMGRFLEVRQADAHAWGEVWLDGKGWTRVDPTAAVAPDRIEQGLYVDFLGTGGDVRFNGVGDGDGGGAFGMASWLRRSHMLWASAEHAWTRWVLTYDTGRQKQVWSGLGIVDWRGMMVWLYGLMALCLLAAILWFRPGRKAPIAPEVRLYQRFAAKLARRGIERGPAEGPLDFARRAATAQPTAADAIREITAEFLALRYGRTPSRQGLDRLRGLIRRFRP